MREVVADEYCAEPRDLRNLLEPLQARPGNSESRCSPVQHCYKHLRDQPMKSNARKRCNRQGPSQVRPQDAKPAGECQQQNTDTAQMLF